MRWVTQSPGNASPARQLLAGCSGKGRTLEHASGFGGSNSPHHRPPAWDEGGWGVPARMDRAAHRAAYNC